MSSPLISSLTRDSISNPVPTADEGMNVLQYWRVINRFKLGVFSICLICLTIGVVVTASITPIYKAKTTLVANPTQPNIDTDKAYVSSALVSLFYETQYDIIRSHNVAQKVLEKLNLIERFRQKQAEQTIKLANGEFDFSQQLKLQWLSFQNKKTPLEAQNNQVLGAMLVKNMLTNLTVEGGRKSEIIRISYDDSDPQLAAEVVNAIAKTYEEFGLESRLSGARKAATWLDDQLEKLKTKFKNSEDALQIFQKKQGMIDTQQHEELVRTRLSALTTEFIQAQIKRSETEIRYNQVYHKLTISDVSLNQVINNRTTQILEQDMIKLAREVKELSERYGEKHPKMIAARAGLKEAKQNLKSMINKVVESIRKQYQAAADHEKELNILIKKTKKDLSSIKGSSFKLSQLEREVHNNQKLYESFLNRFQEASVSDQYDGSNIYIIDAAQVPVKPYKPNKPFVVGVALIIGLFLGMLYSFLREGFDQTFKTPEDLEKKLNISVLGMVPKINKDKNTTIHHAQSDNDPQLVENIRNIRTGLLLSNIDKAPKVILLTSSVPMEGKTNLSINLAVSLSQLNSTLLIEADLRKPSINTLLGISLSPGLSDHLLDENIKLDNVIHHIDHHNKLHVISAGTATSNPPELLTSVNFVNKLEELKKRYTYIVIDSPPILAVSDALILAHLSDRVILGIKSESTKVQEVRETIKRLEKTNIKVSGSVLLQANTKRKDSSGNQYYRYETYAV